MSLEVDGKAGEGSQEPLVLSQQSAASYHTVDFTELGVVAVDGFVFAKESSQSQDTEQVERSESIERTDQPVHDVIAGDVCLPSTRIRSR